MALKDFELRFFEHLKAEFEANTCDWAQKHPCEEKLAGEIISKYSSNPADLVGSDVYALEVLILAMQPTERLVQRAPALRAKYKEMVGEKEFKEYQPAPFPADLDDPKQRRPLLADLQQLVHFLHWTYLFSPLREGLRTRLIQQAILSILGYSVFAAAAIFGFYTWHLPFLAVILTVIYCGVLGGFVSSQRRLQSIPTTGDPLGSFYDLSNGKYFLWFAPMTGGIFAAVLMTVFIGKILQGIIFPEFDAARATTVDVAANWWPFLNRLLPKESKDYALLFLWSFVAGFGERFVPDTLDRLISRGQPKESTGTTGTGTGSGTGGGGTKGVEPPPAPGVPGTGEGTGVGGGAPPDVAPPAGGTGG